MRERQSSTTAEIVCSWRALEASLPARHRILHDPYAKGFLGGVRARAVGAWERMP